MLYESDASSLLYVEEEGECVLWECSAHLCLFMLFLGEVGETCWVWVGSKFGWALCGVAVFVGVWAASGHRPCFAG